jgi:hypothetical protein
MTVTKERMAKERSLADLIKARTEETLVPVLVRSCCPERGCRGFLEFSGRSYQQGMGPLINIHYCTHCGIRDDLAEQYYPRVIYRDAQGQFVPVPGAMHQ